MTNQLSQIKNFPQLVRYLEEELEWPCEEYGFDEITFEYSPEELGIKEEDSAKIKQIRQLRPFYHEQPWGIFFIEFEKKRLPIALLRRILNHLVVKKRVSANQAEKAVWNMDNLLFISAFGEEATDLREIAFAHFHQEVGDLPTLKVLGWDGSDTVLKMEYINKELHEKLHWPSDPKNVDSWKEQWTSAFRHKPGHTIETADALADRLAELARGIKSAAITLMNHESERGELRKLHKAFQTALIHDLTEEDFADTYAQTITYGLLTAAISRTDMSGGAFGTALSAGNVADLVPVTNPFLKEMLQTFIHAGDHKGGIQFDELGIQDVVELLRGEETDLPAVLRDFNNRAPGEDPVIHFYEHFLASYNKKLKVQRGVFYTPKPVVSYIVRSVHELLQTEFGLEDGLADTTTWAEMEKRNPNIKCPPNTDPNSPFVMILDPATGTATFLVEVIDVVFHTLTEKWNKEGKNISQQNTCWNDYVAKHLLPRLYGYELMMAAYAIAHMKVGLKLFETGYKFKSDERVRIFLTNSLEPASSGNNQQSFESFSPALAHEAENVNQVKQNLRFSVVVGNPPYSGSSSNMNSWIDNLLHGNEDNNKSRSNYYEIDGESLNEIRLWLQDDYIKFIRLSQYIIDQTGIGVIGLITNNSFLDGPTHRGMRFQLLSDFSAISIVNLHGSLKRNQDSITGIKDENVFDIQQGVSIEIFKKYPALNEKTSISYFDLIGSRTNKYTWLNNRSQIRFIQVNYQKPWYLFIPTKTLDNSTYLESLSIHEIFKKKSTSIQTSRDNFVIDFSEQELIPRIALMGNDIPNNLFREKFKLDDGRNWKLESARKDIRNNPNWTDSIKDYLYRAFDIRKIVYRDSLVNWPRHEVMDNLDSENLGLLLPRQLAGQKYRHVFCTRIICDMCVVSGATKEAVQLHPLWLKSSNTKQNSFYFNLESNFSNEFIQRMNSALHINFLDKEDVENCFYYIYGILHSPSYRNNFEDFLRLDYPRIPITKNSDLFKGIVVLGEELVKLHLLESEILTSPSIIFEGNGSNFVVNGYPQFKSTSIFINETQSFNDIPLNVWEFSIGGYQVCQKWLKDRRGRELSKDDLQHYKKILVAVNETIRIMETIDAEIDKYGGWPI